MSGTARTRTLSASHDHQGTVAIRPMCRECAQLTVCCHSVAVPPCKPGPRRGHDGRFCVEHPLPRGTTNGPLRTVITLTFHAGWIQGRTVPRVASLSLVLTPGVRVGGRPRIHSPKATRLGVGLGAPRQLFGRRKGCWRMRLSRRKEAAGWGAAKNRNQNVAGRN